MMSSLTLRLPLLQVTRWTRTRVDAGFEARRWRGAEEGARGS